MCYFTTIVLLIATVTINVDSKPTNVLDQGDVPPKFQGTFNDNHPYETIAEHITSWKETDKVNVWELSGLFEGDIMLAVGEENGLIDPKYRWPGGVVPYQIKEDEFAEKDINIIKGAIEEYHKESCIRFRPYDKNIDRDYIRIEGKNSGCWSFVGKLNNGQVVNLQNPGCVYHGTVVHELLHALGFYHQQSATDRDNYVVINWENIESGQEHNFNKYGSNIITDFGVSYDYSSVMHYGAYAFSKNNKPTITPKQDVTIGQNKGLSEKDKRKLKLMYEKECSRRATDEIDNKLIK